MNLKNPQKTVTPQKTRRINSFRRISFLSLFPIVLGSFFLPFLAWILEFFFPIASVIEEILKAILVANIQPTIQPRARLFIAALIGTAFAVSETILYSYNYFQIGSFTFIGFRLLFPLLWHVLTTTTIAIASLLHPKGIFVGIIIAILLHSLYNQAVLGISF